MIIPMTVRATDMVDGLSSTIYSTDGQFVVGSALPILAARSGLADHCLH
jgi:hypothetical protein